MQQITLNHKTILVTGAAGFIGAGLTLRLLRDWPDCTVIGIDNMNNYYDVSLKEYRLKQSETLAGQKDAGSFTFVRGSIADKGLIDSLFDRYRPSVVVNLAAQAGVRYSIEHPDVYIESNIVGFYNILEACRHSYDHGAAGVEHLVYASSSSVYGDHPVLPKKEGQEGKVLSPYALTKKVDEEYGRLYKVLYGLDTYGLRYFNVFGRRQDPDGAYAAVIPKFIRQLMNGERPTINGDGKQSRDFTYIDNVIEANLKACLASSDAAGEAFNIGAGGREYLIDVYYELCKALGKETEPLFGPPRAGDIRDSNADIGKARELLGYNPEYDFAAGIALAIDWYKENLV